MLEKSRRIPSLDGWRGIAILIVLIDHCFPGPATHPGDPWLGWLGQHGVTIFFVLSGYLITTKLLQEKEHNGTIQLGRFYARRFFRLMPCAWTYLGIMSLFGGLWVSEVLACLFFYRAAAPIPGWHHPTGHFWSLSIEEDFYLIWPATLLLLGNKRAFILATCSALLLGLWGLYKHPLWLWIIVFGFVRTPIIVGCVTAFIPARKLKGHASLVGIALLLLVCAIRFLHTPNIPLPESVAIAFLIWSTAQNICTPLCRFLNHPWLVHIGVVSYSIYVWQEAVAYLGSSEWKFVPARFAGAFVAGFISYYMLERPFIQWGARWLAKRSKALEPVSILSHP